MRRAFPRFEAYWERLVASAAGFLRELCRANMVKTQRWKKDELLTRLASLDPDRLRGLLCELYRGGPDKVRDRIEFAVEPSRQVAKPPEDVNELLNEIGRFIALARKGEFLYGKAVSPKRKAQWRHEFRGAFDTSTRLLSSPQSDRAAELLERLIDLAQHTEPYTTFRSQDPVGAARVVVSDYVAALWSMFANREGVEGLVKRALPQLMRWESSGGWALGTGAVEEKERTLADVLGSLVPTRAAWEQLAQGWLKRLDAADRADRAPVEKLISAKRRGRGAQYERESAERQLSWNRSQRGERFVEWHDRLCDALGADDELVKKIITHPAVEGPYSWRVQARAAAQRGELELTSELVERVLKELPGYVDVAVIAEDAGARLSPKAKALLQRGY